MSSEFVQALVSAIGNQEGRALHLFDGPYVVDHGRRAELPEGSKRLVVFVALNGGRVERRETAGTLWPGGSDVRAAGNLRSALWRLRRAGLDIVETDRCTLQLVAGTTVDLSVVADWAARLIEGTATEADLATGAWRSHALDLLPGWYDDWVVFERERLRQRILHGLEAMSRTLVGAGRCAEAIEVALTAVGADPLRESAQRGLVEAHIAEGNVVEARRAYETYRGLVMRELGVTPGAELTALACGAPRSGRPALAVLGRQRELRPPMPAAGRSTGRPVTQALRSEVR